jgi:hypothetical protein
VRPTRLMILMQASVNFEVSTGLAAGFIFPEIPFYWRSNCCHSIYSAVLLKWLSGNRQQLIISCRRITRCRNFWKGWIDLDQFVQPTDPQDVSVVPRQCGNTTGAETSLSRAGDPSAKPYRTRFRRDRPGRSNQRRTEPE